MKSILFLIVLAMGASGLSGCVHKTNLNAPCPDYGKWCHKTPINSWDYSN